jgi:hypothetical protein
MKTAIQACVIAFVAGFVAGCGGGSDSSRSVSPPASSYWTLDSYTYRNGGYSAQSTSSLGGTTGEVHVTRDSAGSSHFSTVGAVPANKKIDVLGGVSGAPQSMMLSVQDAY